MVFHSYTPQQQDPSILREKMEQLGYVGVDIGEDFEQYCKCNHRQCVDLFANLKKELSKGKITIIKEALTRKKDEYKTPEKIEPDERSLVTFFRNRRHIPIGNDGTSGLSLNYVDLTFTGSQERYKEVLTSLPELPELKEMHRKLKAKKRVQNS